MAHFFFFFFKVKHEQKEKRRSTNTHKTKLGKAIKRRQNGKRGRRGVNGGRGRGWQRCVLAHRGKEAVVVLEIRG